MEERGPQMKTIHEPVDGHEMYMEEKPWIKSLSTKQNEDIKKFQLVKKKRKIQYSSISPQNDLLRVS